MAPGCVSSRAAAHWPPLSRAPPARLGCAGASTPRRHSRWSRRRQPAAAALGHVSRGAAWCWTLRTRTTGCVPTAVCSLQSAAGVARRAPSHPVTRPGACLRRCPPPVAAADPRPVPVLLSDQREGGWAAAPLARVCRQAACRGGGAESARVSVGPGVRRRQALVAGVEEANSAVGSDGQLETRCRVSWSLPRGAPPSHPHPSVRSIFLCPFPPPCAHTQPLLWWMRHVCAPVYPQKTQKTSFSNHVCCPTKEKMFEMKFLCPGRRLSSPRWGLTPRA